MLVVTLVEEFDKRVALVLVLDRINLNGFARDISKIEQGANKAAIRRAYFIRFAKCDSQHEKTINWNFRIVMVILRKITLVYAQYKTM